MASEQPAQHERVLIRSMGVALAISADADTATRLRQQWSRALLGPEDDATDPAQVDVSDLPEDPVEHDYALTVRVTLAALEATAGKRLNFHAGAVSDADGRALAVIGASGAGKTTAIAVLARRLGYISDETVSIAQDLVIHPHPKPLSVLLDGDTAKASVSPDDLGLMPTPASARLRRIVLLRRSHAGVEPGEATSYGLAPISTPRAIVEAVAQTSSLVLLPEPMLGLAMAIDHCGGAFALDYAEIDEHVDELLDLLAHRQTSPTGRIHVPGDAPVPDPARWSRSPWRDAVAYDDEVVVMIDDTAHLLGGIGTTTWLALDTPKGVEELVDVACAEHGEHPQARELVESALQQLADRGLVVAPTTTA